MRDAKGCGKPLRCTVAVALVLWLTTATTAAADSPSDPPRAPSTEWPDDGDAVLIAEALDGRTMRLVDGRLVRLADLLAPHPPLGRETAVAAMTELTDQAHARLAALAVDVPLTIHLADATTDRHDRLVAHAVRQDGLWLQEALVAEGLAVVMPLPGSDIGLLRSLMVAEKGAREAGRGLWAHQEFRVRTPTDADAATDAYRVVEGVVRSVADVRGRVYLNFGDDWRTDLTVSIARSDRPAFDAAGIPLDDLTGAVIRARGWLRDFNGPMINARHPAQLEVLPSAAPSSGGAE